MGHKFRLIFKRWLAGCAALAPAGSATYAGELFPYDPPAASAARQMQQRAPQRAVELSVEELRRIDELAREVGKLPTAQKRNVRAEVQNEMDKAVTRSDLQQIRFYNELLRRIDTGQ